LRNRKDLKLQHARAIEERGTLIRSVAAESARFGVTARYGGEKTNPELFMMGGTAGWQENNGLFVHEGRFISEFDVEHRRNVCVLGLDIVEKLFPFEDAIGNEVTLDGYRFTVVGGFEEKGTFFGINRDNIVMIPITTFDKIFGERRSVEISVQAIEPELTEAAIDEVISILRVERGLGPGVENDFDISTRDAIMDAWKNLTRIVFAAAVGICAISLLVGGIGVMNIMLVSVTERTSEIGIRKAVGAKRRDILWQFLVEAIIICEVGGLIGVLLGVGLGQVLGAVSPLPAAVPIWSIFVGLGFVSLVGIFFGFYPAYKAAQLSPIEALRHE
jgi:putative ABC transport system permease protein